MGRRGDIGGHLFWARRGPTNEMFSLSGPDAAALPLLGHPLRSASDSAVLHGDRNTYVEAMRTLLHETV